MRTTSHHLPIVPANKFCSDLSTFVVYVQNIPGNIYALLRIDHEGGEITANTFCADYKSREAMFDRKISTYTEENKQLKN